MCQEMSQIDIYLHQIIDELHPLFTAISDEEMVERWGDDYGVYIRDFLHKTGKKFRMKWRIYYGTPETVVTIFEPAVEI
jgi:hypothetical protein